MGTISEDRRLAEMRRLGLSDPLIALSAGTLLHELFRDACLGPPFTVYHGAGAPDGPELVPLWDNNDRVTGVWERPDGMEFIRFDIESDDEYESLSRTEQGLWTTLFDFLYESDAPLNELKDAAAIVRFAYLDRYLSSREAIEGKLGSFEFHKNWLQDLAGKIDRDQVERT